ncbi:hypothetical protein ACJMK2_026209 [Sinanodonta woodiana]|uniref:Peroxidase n=1 Tax=Sinanodonta woodiana TaxID=1069815 RepID=A0ABD3XKD6_SINWO
MASTDLSRIIFKYVPIIERSIRDANALDKTFFDKGIDHKGVKSKDFFGPHLLTSPRAKNISDAGTVFIGVTKAVAERLKMSIQTIHEQFPRPLAELDQCPFRTAPDFCVPFANSQYRTIDGSCNNIYKGLWGASFTPFERMLPAVYDYFDKPRQTSVKGLPLPLARTISTRFHLPSVPDNLMRDRSHMTMAFGQFLSYDIQRNALATGYAGAIIDCCTDNVERRQHNCFPIEIPTDDPYYSPFNRTCMNFVRAFPTPNLACTLGQREQLNQNTHYIDGSQIYGSDKSTSDSLRSFTGGTLKTGLDPDIPNMLPKDTNNSANCILPQLSSNVQCFMAGDVRVNEQPALASLHTIFMREHNRIATGLSALNNSWSDQVLFDEARKIIGAMLQHITYNEYLPEILGSAIMNSYDLNPAVDGYTFDYDIFMNPSIRNEFATAAFRFGHSMVHDSLKYRGSSLFLKDVFNNPATLYRSNGGIDGIIKGLLDFSSQKVDERLSKQITRNLFERQAGFGADLAAINIQRGRDHGIPSYLSMKAICNVSDNVHNPSVWSSLKGIYNVSDDIELFPAGVSEQPVPGGKVGKTFACIIAKQFEALKKGDRYYYEREGNQAFTLAQLRSIRETTLSKVICRNTGLHSVPPKAFRIDSSPYLRCNSVADIDYNHWKCGWFYWGPWTQCVNFIRFQLRTCSRPRPCTDDACPGNSFHVEMCDSHTGVDILRIRTNIRMFESALSQEEKINGVIDLSTARDILKNLARQ